MLDQRSSKHTQPGSNSYSNQCWYRRIGSGVCARIAGTPSAGDVEPVHAGLCQGLAMADPGSFLDRRSSLPRCPPTCLEDNLSLSPPRQLVSIPRSSTGSEQPAHPPLCRTRNALSKSRTFGHSFPDDCNDGKTDPSSAAEFPQHRMLRAHRMSIRPRRSIWQPITDHLSTLRDSPTAGPKKRICFPEMVRMVPGIFRV